MSKAPKESKNSEPTLINDHTRPTRIMIRYTDRSGKIIYFYGFVELGRSVGDQWVPDSLF
jgi:hypothetical protein